MSPFGFTPDNGDEENPKPDDFAAMMRQMQEQIQKQFQQLGINPAGFINPFANFAPGGKGQQEALPIATVRDTAKKFVQAQGSQPLGIKDVTVVNNALEIAELWLNEATVFPATAIGAAHTSLSRLDWVDETLPGWQATMEPLATGLASAISGLLDQAVAGQGENLGVDGGADALAGSMGAIAGLLRSFIGSMIATQLGQAIGAISSNATGAHDVALPLLDPARPILIPENIENQSRQQTLSKMSVRSLGIALFRCLQRACGPPIKMQSPRFRIHCA